MAAFRFSVPLGLGTIAMFVINFGDRFFLSYYRTLTDVGIYAVAYKIGMLMSLVHASFHTYWYSQVYAVARRDDADYVIARIFTYMMLALSFTLVALIVLCRPTVAILVTRPGFETAAFVAPVIVLAYYARAIGDFFRCFLLVAGHSTYDAACNWIGAVVCMAAYFILIPRYGMWGAAGATLLTFLVIAVVSAVWSYRIRPFRVEGGRLFTIGAVSAALVGIHFLIGADSLAVQIVWAVILIAAFPALLWVLPFAGPGEVLKLQMVVRTGLDRGRRLAGFGI
jgi:O-antigen/teichoic acid export membrane protein